MIDRVTDRRIVHNRGSKPSCSVRWKLANWGKSAKRSCQSSQLTCRRWREEGWQRVRRSDGRAKIDSLLHVQVYATSAEISRLKCVIICELMFDAEIPLNRVGQFLVLDQGRVVARASACVSGPVDVLGRIPPFARKFAPILFGLKASKSTVVLNCGGRLRMPMLS